MKNYITGLACVSPTGPGAADAPPGGGHVRVRRHLPVAGVRRHSGAAARSRAVRGQRRRKRAADRCCRCILRGHAPANNPSRV